MTRQPAVSVVIIFLDAEKFLGEAVESVFAQTLEDWELLLVDDGSSDSSTEIARGYAARHPGRVRYLEHPGHVNRGMSATRNLGIRHARGRYVALLDADDVWLPHKLEDQVSILEAEPGAAMVYGVTHYWFGWTGNPEDARRDYDVELGVPPGAAVAPPELLVLLLESRAPTPCPSDILVRRDAVEAVGGFQENFTGIYQLFEDQAFLSKLYLRWPVHVAGERWFKYRQHPDSCVSAADRAGRKHAAGLFYFDWLAEYLTAQGVADERVWRALREKRWRYRHPALHRLSARSREAASRADATLRRAARQVLPDAVLRRLKAGRGGEPGP